MQVTRLFIDRSPECLLIDFRRERLIFAIFETSCGLESFVLRVFLGKDVSARLIFANFESNALLSVIPCRKVNRSNSMQSMCILTALVLLTKLVCAFEFLRTAVSPGMWIEAPSLLGKCWVRAGSKGN